MRPKSDPIRLSADPSSPSKLRELLAQGRQNVPTQAALHRLSSRVEGAILAGVPTPHLPPIGKAGFTGLAGKLGIVGLAAVAAVAGGTLWSARHAAPVEPAFSAPATVPSVAATADVAVEEPKAAVDDSSALPAESSVRPHDASSRNPGPPNSTSSSNSVAHDGNASTASELVLLNMARTALRSNPRRAFALTQEHTKRFANGALVQEREVIAIEALSRLGQVDAARARARDFERRFPGSAHQSKIDQLTREK